MPLHTFLNGGSAIRLRGLQWMAMSDFGRIGAGSVVSDSGGGGTMVWTYGGTIPCRIDPLAGGADTDVVAGRIDERSTHILTVPSGTSATSNSRVLVVGRGTFEVTAVRTRTDEWVGRLEAVQVL